MLMASFITECQGGEFAPDGYYSPQANDVWSLGIVLLNLATGRNPWKSATDSDPTFQAYLLDPATFLPSVLPISRACNDLLLRMLDVNWRTRITLPEVRRAVMRIDSFYCDGVLFEGSMARCPWEAGMDLDSDEEEELVNDIDEHAVDDWRKKPGVYSVDESSSSSNSSSSSEDYCDSTSKGSRAIADSLAGIPPRSSKSALAQAVTETSQWSADSATSEIIFASRAPSIAFGEDDISSMGAPWTDFTSSKATWGCESSASPSPIHKSTFGYPPDVIDFHLDDGLVSDASVEPYVHVARSGLVFSPSQSHLDDGLDGFGERKPELTLDMHLDAWRQVTPLSNTYLSSHGASMVSISTQSSDTMQTAHEYGDYTSSSIYFLADSSILHSPQSPRDFLSIPISTESSAYEDPSSVLLADDLVAQPLTQSRDTEMASPSKGDSIWRTSSLTRVSVSRLSSPSRYSVASAGASPLRAKWSDSDLGDEAQKRRISCIDPSDWSVTFGAASVKSGGIRSPYYAFRRSNAPSPEESAVRVVQEGSLGVPHTRGSDAFVGKVKGDESQPTFHVDVPKLTNNGDSCLPPLRSITESPLDASQSDASDSQERLEPQRFLETQFIPPEEHREQDGDAKTPVQAKPGRPTALIIAMRFLSRAGSPTQQKTPSCPHTSDSTTPKRPFETLVATEEAKLSPTQAPTHVESAIPSTQESNPSNRLLSTRRRLPARSGTIPASQPRSSHNAAISRHPRRATVHIGSIFHRPGAESEHPSAILSTLAAAAEALSASGHSPLSTPEGTNASSSSSTSPLATPSRTGSPVQISSAQAPSPASTPSSASSQCFPTLSSRRSPTSAGRNRRWTVNGWSKVSSLVIPDRKPAHEMSLNKELPPDPCMSIPSYPILPKHNQKSDVDRSDETNHQKNEECTQPSRGGVRRRRGWLPNLLSKRSYNGFDLHKVVKMPIEAGKWLGSLSGGSSRSKSGNSGAVKNVGVAGIIW